MLVRSNQLRICMVFRSSGARKSGTPHVASALATEIGPTKVGKGHHGELS